MAKFVNMSSQILSIWARFPASVVLLTRMILTNCPLRKMLIKNYVLTKCINSKSFRLLLQVTLYLWKKQWKKSKSGKLSKSLEHTFWNSPCHMLLHSLQALRCGSFHNCRRLRLYWKHSLKFLNKNPLNLCSKIVKCLQLTFCRNFHFVRIFVWLV